MDIFNRKRIEELESELRDIKRENEDLRSSLHNAEAHLAVLLEIQDNTPEDCKPGPYCVGCNFVKEYHYHNYVRGYKSYTCYNKRLNGYVCGKGGICKNFVQKEIKE